jgi:LemA protein
MAKEQKPAEAPKQPLPVRPLWIVLGIIGLVLLIIIATVWGSYNSLVRLDQNVDKNWADVQTQYQRRVDLIPNLVNVVESYAIFERDTLTQITALRSQWQNAPSQEAQVQAGNQLEGALSRLLLIAENYPQLQTNQNFLSLQDSLAETENMVATARTRYNGAVRDYNSAVRVFPSNVIAGMFGFSTRTYFEATPGSDQAPVVNITV